MTPDPRITPEVVEGAAKSAWMAYLDLDDPKRDWEDDEDFRERQEQIAKWPKTGLSSGATVFRKCAKAVLTAALAILDRELQEPSEAVLSAVFHAGYDAGQDDATSYDWGSPTRGWVKAWADGRDTVLEDAHRALAVREAGK